MSKWSYVKGIVEVSPSGRTQAECRYILETVLAHLPKVTGSEEDMYTHIVQCAGHSTSSSCNEFGEWMKNSWLKYQDNYIIVVEGHFRDREFDETYRSFVKWLNRLAKRIWVNSCLIRISGNTKNWEEKSEIINLDNLCDCFEDYSWCGNGTVNWCEYLMWQEPRDKKGQISYGKPDFHDGGCLDLMTEKERVKRLHLNKRGKKQ